MYLKKVLGKYGEEIACKYLLSLNSKVLDRNFMCNQGEIDIIALSELNELVFLEVKTRKNLKYGRPCESITPYKIRHIVSSSKYYIYLKNFYNYNVRYDVIEVYVKYPKIVINHIKNAF